MAANSSGQSSAKKHQTTLKGCLGGSSPDFYITTITANPAIDGAQYHYLTGNTSRLSGDVGKEVSILGTEDDSAGRRNSFNMTKVVHVYERPKPRLSPSFSDLSNWQTERSQAYGIEFKHPPRLPNTWESGQGFGPNFVGEDKSVPLGGFEIPRDAYPGTNFVGGGLSVFVNPKITNRESCEQFGVSGAESASQMAVGGIKYSKMAIGSGGSNIFFGYYYLHTFQSGLCYELALELDSFGTGGLTDGGCTIGETTEADDLKLIEDLLAVVAFFPR